VLARLRLLGISQLNSGIDRNPRRSSPMASKAPDTCAVMKLSPMAKFTEPKALIDRIGRKPVAGQLVATPPVCAGTS